MSKRPKKNASNSSETTLRPLPKKAIQTNWDLKKLYYRSEKDPQIEQDVRKAEQAYHAFAKKYRDTNFTSSTKKLLPALHDLEKLAGLEASGKPGQYFYFRHALDAKDTTAEKFATQIGNRLRKASNEILFFEIELGRISKKQQKEFLTDDTLARYHYYLERLFLEAQHDLSEPEERIMRLKSGPAYGMWVTATDKIVSNRHVTYKKEDIPLNEALERLDQLPPKEKPVLWERIMREMERIGEFAENEFTAILNDAKVDDELRGYKKPYSESVLGNEDNIDSVEALLAAVRGKGYALSRKFYKLKAAHHGLAAIPYARKYDSIGATRTIPFTEAVGICRGVFYDLKEDYGRIFDEMLQSGKIDAFPKKGKRGGAFMAASVNLPTQVFLNHTDTFKSLETLAHEMGHAIHSERSKSQPTLYQDHSITTAETASTLFENLVFDAVYKEASEAEQAVLLHDRITRDIATIERQIAFFDTELALHDFVRTHGAITNTELRDIMCTYLRKYLGPGVDVRDEDGYSYVYVSHFRYGFYVYTYSFGILMSTIMADRYKEDPSYIKEIDRFLCAGRSDSVEQIFKMIDIDTDKEETFTDALKSQEADIKRFEKLTRSTGK